MAKNIKNNSSVDFTDFSVDFDKLTRRQRIIRSVKARMDAKRSLFDKTADIINSLFGTNFFLLINAVWFVIWIAINSGTINGVTPFDPFPFGFLTMVVSLEAIFLSIFVLISQKRASKIDDLREEIHLQINTIAEEEITKILKMQVLILNKLGVDISQDVELQEMVLPTDQKKIERSLERQLT